MEPLTRDQVKAYADNPGGSVATKQLADTALAHLDRAEKAERERDEASDHHMETLRQIREDTMNLVARRTADTNRALRAEARAAELESALRGLLKVYRGLLIEHFKMDVVHGEPDEQTSEALAESDAIEFFDRDRMVVAARAALSSDGAAAAEVLRTGLAWWESRTTQIPMSNWRDIDPQAVDHLEAIDRWRAEKESK